MSKKIIWEAETLLDGNLDDNYFIDCQFNIDTAKILEEKGLMKVNYITILRVEDENE